MRGAGRAVRPAGPKEGPKNGIVTEAIDELKKLKPAPLGVPDDARPDPAANYEEHLELLAGCDLVIEAIAERMDWKLDLYKKIAPHVAPHAILASQHLGPVDHQAERGPAPGAQGALLRHPLLQPAALHGAGRADPHADHAARDAGPARSLRHQRRWARTWCAPRTRRTSSPTASASPACWRR